MKRKLFSLVTLLLCAVTGAWAAAQTTLIDGISLPSIPTGTYTGGTVVMHNASNKAVVVDGDGYAVMQAIAPSYGSPIAANFTWANACNGSDDASWSTTGTTWEAPASTQFVGSTAYTTSGNAHYVNFARRGNLRTTRTFAYRFTNCTAVSALVKSNGETDASAAVMAVYSVSGSTQTMVKTVLSKTKAVDVITIDGLSQSDTYVAYIYGANTSNGELYEVSFLTPTDTRSGLTLTFEGEGGVSSVDIAANLSTSLSWTEDTSSESAKYTVSYASANNDIATVNATTGVITGVAEGTVNIIATVTATADATYKTTTKTLSVTVVDPSKVYNLTTASASISLRKDEVYGDGADRKPYLTANTDKWSSGEDPYDGIEPPFNNMSQSSRTLTINVKNVAAFNVRVYNGTNGRKYRIFVNDVEKTVITHGGTGVESSGLILTGSTGSITIKLTGFNDTGASVYPVRILLYQNVEDVTVPSSGIGTYSSANAIDYMSLPEGLKAYKVSAITSSVALTEVAEAVEGGTGIILQGDEGSYVVPVAVSGSNISATNKLKASVTATAIAANEAYILQSGQFHLVNAASTIPANKAYLDANDVPTSARELALDFSGETTGIEAVKTVKQGNGEYYNLAGQRVAQPSKGLYIVNGKKVIIK